MLGCKLGQTATETHGMNETVYKNEAVRYSYASLRMVWENQTGAPRP